MHGDVSRAADVASIQGVRSLDLKRDGIVDRIASEPPDATRGPGAFLDRIAKVLEHELTHLLQVSPETRLATRRDRYRRVGLAP